MIKHKQEKRIFLNNQIRGDKILVIDENWEKKGIFSKSEALSLAEDKGVDLIQVGFNPKDNVVVAKLMDYGKYMYQLKKQEKEKKKHQKVKWMKEIKFGYNIWKNDLEVKLEKARQLLEEWYSVRFFWELRWREYIYKDKMLEKLNYIKDKLQEYWKPQDIKEERRWYSLVLFTKVR